MGIDPAPFWANLFLYHFESSTSLHLPNSRVHYNFHSIGRCFDELSVINFFENFKEIYSKELDLKLEHRGSHATFFRDIEIKDGIFVYKLFDKRDESIRVKVHFRIAKLKKFFPFFCPIYSFTALNSCFLKNQRPSWVYFLKDIIKYPMNSFCILLILANERCHLNF